MKQLTGNVNNFESIFIYARVWHQQRTKKLEVVFLYHVRNICNPHQYKPYHVSGSFLSAINKVEIKTEGAAKSVHITPVVHR